jgi:hypothetical protein
LTVAWQSWSNCFRFLVVRKHYFRNVRIFRFWFFLTWLIGFLILDHLF